MQSPVAMSRFVRQLVGNDAREHFVALLLDGRHRAIAYQVVSVGTATASLVHPQEVFQTAVGLGAVALIVAHSHSSGDSTPSSEDREVTRRLARAGEVLGIRVLDHVIVAARGYRVDGRTWLRLPVGKANARGPQSAGRPLGLVAGGRFATDETGRVPVVPYRMRAWAPLPAL